MKTRIITALVLIAIFAVLMWLDIFWLNYALFGVVFVAGTYESLKLYGLEDKEELLAVGVALYLGAYFCSGENGVGMMKYLLFIITMIAGYLAYIKAENLSVLKPFLYPCVPLILMLWVYKDLSNIHLIWLIVIVASCDSGAYFIGKAIGKNKFSPTSPNKTLEGVFGGLACGVIIGGLFGLFFTNFTFKFSIMLSVIVGIFGVFGDLFESYLKREAGVKDSGNILPGHGGILDRLDGYMFGAVAMFVVFA
ncbi:MAG: phosphatidate cytidylyltransferase [Campylobacter sp.]|nr:phosphatidate cytidylyltransferase [Campylobacter sp.]